ncbi:ATP-binding cassette subfamily C protein CydC [Salsuginibacillus halophilus]|uniref:ATP-binding cassette subfamily C protein CydC n=1 Tax=Salsuginibacillus halophilus TaxID=517424 RepID=A0A2P8HW24_9BACI|nr:thiol reductant ABC exporter subunit CydC [Salsuginibacillus halophilus]PSL50429.1 ATP-binding cassette subfamily C protein CydC [Salsuginibacillus halophilus]
MRELKDITSLVLQEKKTVWMTLAFGLFAGLAGVSLFSASGYLISIAALETPIYILTIFIVLIKLLGFLRAGARYVERYVSHDATFMILKRLRTTFFSRLIPEVPRLFNRYPKGELLNRVTADVENLQYYFLRVLYPPLLFTVVMLFVIAFYSVFSLWQALAVAVAFIVTLLVMPALGIWRLRRRDDQVQQARGRLMTEAADVLHGRTDLFMANELDDHISNLKETSKQYSETAAGAERSLRQQETWQLLVSFTVVWVVTAIAGFEASAGELGGVYIAMLILLAMVAFETAEPLGVFPYHFHQAAQAAGRLHDVTEDKESTVQTAMSADPPSFTLHKAGFHYPGETLPALDQANASIPAARHTAVVGASGAGKTVLLHVLLRVLTATDGRVEIHGQSAENISPESLWEMTNVSLQEHAFFQGTIRDNLNLREHDVTDEALLKALQDAEAGEFSLDAVVEEQGRNLSGGERQRLALARLFLHDAPLWMLDEPLTGIDPASRVKLKAKLKERTKGRTVVWVTHELSEVEDADHVVVLQDGTVVEEGTYIDLMTRGGTLCEMKQVEKNMLQA